MGDSAEGASPPRSQAEDEFEALWTEYTGFCTDPRNGSIFGALGRAVVERLGVAPSSVLGAAITGLVAGLPALVVPIVVAAVTSQLSGASIWRWAIVSLWFAFVFGYWAVSGSKSVVEQFSMDRALTNVSDLRREIEWMRRHGNLRKASVFATLYTLASLVVIALLAGTQDLRSLSSGDMAELAIILYFSGEFARYSVVWIFGIRVSSELDYRVSWPSPLDSPWIRPALRGQANNEFSRGLSVTGLIVVSAVLLSARSPLLFPVLIVLISTGYVTILASIVAARLAFRRIVRRARDARLADLQAQIDSFGERPTELGEAQFAELTRLLEIRDMIDRAPTNLSARDGVARLVKALALPTLTFVLSVVAQEYFGRWVDKILP